MSQPQRKSSGRDSRSSRPTNTVALLLVVLFVAFFLWRGGMIQQDENPVELAHSVAVTATQPAAPAAGTGLTPAQATEPSPTVKPAMESSAELTQEPTEEPPEQPTEEPAQEPTDTPAPTATTAPTATAKPAPTATTAPTATAKPAPAATVARASDLPIIDFDDLPRQARETIALIDAGGPFPYSKDGSTFQNREGILPDMPRGYYSEYTVITPGSDDRGARRIVAGEEGELYYTDDHYDSFREVMR